MPFVSPLDTDTEGSSTMRGLSTSAGDRFQRTAAGRSVSSVLRAAVDTSGCLFTAAFTLLELKK